MLPQGQLTWLTCNWQLLSTSFGTKRRKNPTERYGSSILLFLESVFHASHQVEEEYTSERWSLDRWFSCKWHFTSKAAQGGGKSFKRESTYVTRKNWPKEMFQHFGHASHTWRAASVPNISIYPSATGSSSHDFSRLFSLLSFSQLSTCLNLHNLEVSWLDFLWWPINLSTYHYWMLLDTRGTP